MKWFSFIKDFVIDTIFPPDPGVLKLENMAIGDFLAKMSIQKTPEDIFYLFKYKDHDISLSLITIKTYYNQKIVRLLVKGMEIGLLELIKSRGLNNPLLVPIAMTGKSRRERGWNQCELLCEGIVSGKVKIEYRKDILIKIRKTKDQVGRNRAERIENLKNSFAVKKKFIECVKNRDVILFDDIVTTGSTLMEAKRAFRDSGCVGKIICLAMAH